MPEPGNPPRLRRVLVRIMLALVALVGLGIFGIAMARARVGLLGPHVVQVSLARFDAPLEAAIRYQIEAEKPQNIEDALRFSLKVTGQHLRFGLGHPTKYAFGAEHRSGNCIEYAHLFVRIFEMTATRGKIAAKAHVVHSSRAEVFGRALPFPGLRDHDWVVIVDKTDKRQWFVDPAFDDAGLGWDLTPNVVGDVRVIP
ncbi:MAG TPA: hypothetical protein PK156_33435 [Polyangium sp.]|nr:hypothetical protein [Polyangium sp.]